MATYLCDNHLHLVVPIDDPAAIAQAIAVLEAVRDHNEFAVDQAIDSTADRYLSRAQLRELFLQDVAPNEHTYQIQLFGKIWRRIIRFVVDNDPAYSYRVRCASCKRSFSHANEPDACPKYSEDSQDRNWQLGAYSFLNNQDAFLRSNIRYVQKEMKGGYERLGAAVATWLRKTP